MKKYLYSRPLTRGLKMKRNDRPRKDKDAMTSQLLDEQGSKEDYDEDDEILAPKSYCLCVLAI